MSTALEELMTRDRVLALQPVRDGKISEWREHMDGADLAAQLGIDAGMLDHEIGRQVVPISRTCALIASDAPAG